MRGAERCLHLLPLRASLLLSLPPFLGICSCQSWSLAPPTPHAHTLEAFWGAGKITRGLKTPGPRLWPRALALLSLTSAPLPSSPPWTPASYGVTIGSPICKDHRMIQVIWSTLRTQQRKQTERGDGTCPRTHTGDRGWGGEGTCWHTGFLSQARLFLCCKGRGWGWHRHHQGTASMSTA